MFTYLALDVVVLAALGIVIALRPQKLDWKAIGVVLALLLAMTAVFDSLLVGEHIVAYQASKILGIYIDRAPIEDFAYTLAVAVLIPYLWKFYAPKD